MLTTYTWDAENHLLSVANAGGTEAYAYSADGMRETKVSGGATVHYVRDGENVLSETDGALATVAQHTDLPGMWGGKFVQRRSGASRFCVPVFPGNTRALLDAAASVTDTLVTDAWGVDLARTGGTVDPFLASGQCGYHRDAASQGALHVPLQEVCRSSSVPGSVLLPTEGLRHGQHALRDARPLRSLWPGDHPPVWRARARLLLPCAWVCQLAA